MGSGVLADVEGAVGFAHRGFVLLQQRKEGC